MSSVTSLCSLRSWKLEVTRFTDHRPLSSQQPSVFATAEFLNCHVKAMQSVTREIRKRNSALIFAFASRLSEQHLGTKIVSASASCASDATINLMSSTTAASPPGPKCARTGSIDVNFVISFNDGHRTWMDIQGWAKECSLCCMNPASRLPLAAGFEFTQPRDHSLAGPCRSIAFIDCCII